MKQENEIKIKNWLVFIFLLISNFSLWAQNDSDDQATASAASANFPKVISCDCEPSVAKCEGTIIWEDGSKYEGEFEFGKIQGKGKLTLTENEIYEGTFKNETFEGQGKMTYEDGSVYTGGWVSGYRQGEGYLVYPDGSEYLGEFEDDQIHGEGAMILSNGESYSGNWEYGQTNGYGVITRMDGSVFAGMNREGTRDGPGIITWESGDTLHGSWEDGKMAGEGIFQFEDGSTMISNWENGVMKDENSYIKPDGERFTGSSRELVAQVLQSNWQEEELIERNFGFAFYSIGVEYKYMMDLDRAQENLQYAAQFGGSNDNSFIKDMVDTQMASIEEDKDKNSGVAKRGEKDQ